VKHIAHLLSYVDVFHATRTCKSMRAVVDPLLDEVRELFRVHGRKGFSRLAFMTDDPRKIQLVIEQWHRRIPLFYITSPQQYARYKDHISAKKRDAQRFRLDASTHDLPPKSLLDVMCAGVAGRLCTGGEAESRTRFSAAGLCIGGHLNALKSIDMSMWLPTTRDSVASGGLFTCQWDCVDYMLATYPGVTLTFRSPPHIPYFSPHWKTVLEAVRKRYPNVQYSRRHMFYGRIANSDEEIFADPNFARTIPEWYADSLFVEAVKTCQNKHILLFLLKNTRRSAHRKHVAKNIRKYSMFRLQELFDTVSRNDNRVMLKPKLV
jgi:hypothetical protein